jgi:uncharacterized protein
MSSPIFLKRCLAALFFMMAGLAWSACLPQPDLEKAFSRADTKLAKDAGYLWKLEKNGRVSHLYGTMHLLPENLMLPGIKTMQAIQQSDAIALEINPLDAQVVQELQSMLKGAPNTMPVNVAQEARMRSIAQKLCVEEMIKGDLPWSFKYIQLGIAQARQSGLEAAFGREVILAVLASSGQKPIHSLETTKAQMQALTLNWNVPSTVVDKYLTQLEGDDYARILRKMLSFWSTNNLEQLAAYTDWCECADDPAEKKLFSQMNDARNPGIAIAIDRLHASGQRVFAAVGALHMAGPQALPTLLQQKGYRITRVF